ncbi:hypothetical protein EMPS_06523 [Entomortierella parvispora]|uniref:Glutathione S-transferase n=1 Tax=Entomortierella parvispora TaxID=205924 RepID=A0A9P3HCS4_9FUNG|nr:hypothetical protein EMPS_06523 [Entomortierella parvispora]
MKVYNLDSTENSKLIKAEGLQYKLLYFGMHYGGTSARGILAYANADWEPVFPTPNWGVEKPNAPFEMIPVLTVIHPTGQKLVLAENVAIDIFLAKQFGLHGENAWEEALINSFYSNSNTFFYQEIMNIFFWESSSKDEEEKAKYLDTFLNEQLSNWARIHEAHLENNHLNGHYVGNRATLADIRTTTMLDSLEKIIGKERVATVVNEAKTPGILKVRHLVESKDSYAGWIQSAEYKKLDVKSESMLRDHHPELLPSSAVESK